MKAKSRLAAVLIAALGACLFSAATPAQTYPERAVTFVVGFSPGSSIDLVARTVAKNLSTRLKQAIVVENKPGAGGNLAAEVVARAKPDGYTLLVVANSIAISPAVYPNLNFDVKKDLAAIAYMGIGPVIMKVNRASRLDSVKALVEYARANPEKLNYGSSGEGGTPHMATALFEQVAGIRMTHIPYKGGGEALAALLGGQVDLLINPLLGDTKSDKIASLAITGNARSPLAPEVPTFKELGYDFNVGVYYGLMGQKAIPGNIVAKLNEAVNEALADKEVVDALTARSGIVLQRMTAAEFQDYINKDIDLWKRIVAKK